MTSAEILEVLNGCIAQKRLCAVKNYYETDTRFLLPLSMAGDCYLSAVEDGRRFNGYLWDRYASVESAIPAGEQSDRLLRESGLLDGLAVPDVDVETPEGFFAWLVSMEVAVILECGRPEHLDAVLLMGAVTECTESGFSVRCFHTDCTWEPRDRRFSYGEVRRVIFGTEALGRFSRMLPDLPR